MVAKGGLKLKKETGGFPQEGSRCGPLERVVLCRLSPLTPGWTASFLCHLEMVHCGRGWFQARDRSQKAPARRFQLGFHLTMVRIAKIKTKQNKTKQKQKLR